MKKSKLFSCLVVFMMVVSMITGVAPVQAADSDYTYTDNGDGTCTITDYSGTGGNVVIPSTLSGRTVTAIEEQAFANKGLTSVTIPSSVKSIGRWAFQQNSDLISVTIPNGVTSIGNYAFQNNPKLASIEIPSSITSIGDDTFSNCRGLASVTIPNSVTSIGAYAFKNTGLTGVTIPSSILSIGNYAFAGSSSLAKVYFDGNMPTLGEYDVFDPGPSYYCPTGNPGGINWGSVTVKELDTKPVTVAAAVYDYITPSTYAGMPGETISLKITPAAGYVLQSGSLQYNDSTGDHTVNGSSFTMPDNAITISAVFTGESGDYTYTNNGDGTCTITGYSGAGGSVTIPSTLGGLRVTAIGNAALNGEFNESCAALTSVTIPDGVTSIGEHAFDCCTNLTTIEIPASVTSIGGCAFSGTSLLSVTIPDSVTSIEEGTFEGCENLASVTLPVNLTAIRRFAFCGCTSLTSVTIPAGVTSIGENAFNSCSGLTSVTISDGVESIWDGAFANSGLTGSITIPANVKSIDHNAFNQCDKLTGINVDAGNQNYSSMYGVLYDKDQSDLLFCPLGLTSVTIPYGVTSIVSGAFFYCNGLTSVTIPASVTSIGKDAFCQCPNLASVYFDGTPTMNDGLDTFSGCSGSLTFFCPTGNPGNITLTPLTQLDTKPITVAAAVYDYITPSTYAGMPGETISLKITPAAGYVLQTGSLQYNDGTDHAISGTSFTMPDANVTVSGEFEAIAPVTGVTLNKTSTSIEKGSSETLTATVVPADASNKNVTWSSDQPGIASVDQTGKVTAVAAGTAAITVTTANGNKTAVCQVTVIESATTVTASTDQTIPISGPTNITVPQGVTGAKMDIDPANPLPQITVSASTALGTILAEIPAGTTVSGPAGWNGEITLPTVKASPSAAITGAQTVDTVIEVGLGNDTIKFSKAVRLLVPNMAGKAAGFVRNGVFTPITATISADSQSAADTGIPDGGEAKIKAVNDLVIWTKHFTEFVAYTPAAVISSGGGGGGGSASQYINTTTGSATVYPAAGGKVGLGSDAIVEIPANALQGTSGVTVKVQKVESPLSIPAGFKSGSDVFEFTVDGKTSYSFNKPVTITLKFDTTAGSIPAIYYYDSQSSQWLKVGGTVSGSTISVSVDHFTQYTVLAENQTQQKTANQPNSFTDLDKHWAKQFVEKLAGLGAVSGYPDGGFKPDAPITRAEFVTILVKALKLTASGNGPAFKDTAGHWASSGISIAAESGLISGYGDNCFKPDSLITREEMAVIAVKAIKLQQSSGETTFTDNAQVSPWAKGSVKAAVNNNIMTGYPGNTIRSQGNTTRAEAVTVIVKLVK